MRTRAWASWSGRSGVWLLGVGLGLAGACGGESKDPPLNPTGAGAVGGAMPPPGAGGNAGSSSGGSAGKGGTGGKGGMTGEGGDGGEIAPSPDGPIVEVVSPEPVTDPDGGEVLIESEVTVTCEARARAGGLPVDPSTVAVQLLDADDNVVDDVAAAPTGEPDEYAAEVILEKVTDNGVVGFRCTAGDTSTPPLLGADTIHSLVDHGPLITVTSPAPESTHPLMGALRVRFSVDADPVGSGDSGAAVDVVTLEINGVAIDPGAPDRGDYDVSVDLTDPTLFALTPAGEIPVTITAANRRDPAATRVVSYGFNVDGEGPQISILSPVEAAIVGGRVPLRFTIEDEHSGVDRDSVAVSLNLVEFHYGEGGTWLQMGNDFVFTFDSAQLAGSKVQATINIRANDGVGNPADGAKRNLNLDNLPPTVDLDPEFVRESKESGEDIVCSAAFDPLGPRAANDKTMVGRAPTIRTLAWEETNYVPGQPIIYYSGTKEDSVYVYLQADPSEALLTDSDMDGQCDRLAIDGLPFLEMTAKAREATAWYWADDPSRTPALSECIASPANDPEPQHLCTSGASDMVNVVAHPMEGRPPVVYINADGTGTGCTGTFWEIGSIAEEGWICLAGVAEDEAGNVGISPPLRLCYNDPDTAEVPACATSLADPPSCTDGCTPPPRFAGYTFRPE